MIVDDGALVVHLCHDYESCRPNGGGSFDGVSGEVSANENGLGLDFWLSEQNV